MRILGTGLSGLVGSRVVELLKDQFDFENLSLETGVDITDDEEVSRRIENFEGSIVLHMAAKTDVDGCEGDKRLGEDGDAWKINVLGTKNIVDACKAGNKKVLYISTDFVFDGKLKNGAYTEENKPKPMNWYGQTKFEGEKIVISSGLPYGIIRIAYPYRAAFEAKKDFVWAILGRLARGERMKAVTDHMMTPTFIDDIADALALLTKNNAAGLYHVVGSQFVSPYEACLRIAKIFGYNKFLIAKTTRAKYFEGRAPRPYNLALSNGKIVRLGVKMSGFEEGLEEIKRQLL